MKERSGSMTKRMVARVRNIMITGIILLTPLLLTVWILYVFAHRLDSFFQPIITPWLGYRIPGLGIILALLLVFITGLIAPNYLGRRIQRELERLIMRVPVVRSIYGTIRKVIEALHPERGREFKRVVLVPYPRRGMYALAFLTGEAGVPEGRESGSDGRWYYVFIPHTPNPTTGHVIVVPEKDILAVEMTPQEVFQLLVSAGLAESGATEADPDSPVREDAEEGMGRNSSGS